MKASSPYDVILRVVGTHGDAEPGGIDVTMVGHN
jgi:hypothetical protein